MLFADVIRKKRDGKALSDEDIRFFVSGLADESIPPEQVSALAMAIFFRSMSFEEAGALTNAMARSGQTLSWDPAALGGPIIDKHSTGGVGDKVSFMLAPIAAACGCFVPMISGRGLGHTGGTLDKITSVPGYDPLPSLEKFRRTVEEVGCAIVGQTAALAPADRRLYAIRDITATVESIPLITASILSKKIAAGNQGLVMDVKWGSGAFMETPEGARSLAQSIIATAATAGLVTHALVTDMNQALGVTVGNGLEIAEAVRYLANEEREPRLDAVVLALSGEMLVLTGLETDRDKAVGKAEAVLRSGEAAETFARMIAALGGPADFVERYEHYLPAAPIVRPVVARDAGILAAVDTRALGNALIELGGGRRRVDDTLDLSVGFSAVAPIGAALDRTRPLAIVHARTVEAADAAAGLLIDACTIAGSAPPQRPPIHSLITPGDVRAGS